MSGDDTKIILEHFDDKFVQLLESMDVMIDSKLQPIAEDVTELKDDMKVVKAAVKATNKDLLEYEQRTRNLENAA